MALRWPLLGLAALPVASMLFFFRNAWLAQRLSTSGAQLAALLILATCGVVVSRLVELLQADEEPAAEDRNVAPAQAAKNVQVPPAAAAAQQRSTTVKADRASNKPTAEAGNTVPAQAAKQVKAPPANAALQRESATTPTQATKQVKAPQANTDPKQESTRAKAAPAPKAPDDFDMADLDIGDDDLPQAPTSSRICQVGLGGLPVLLHVYDVSNNSGVQIINQVLAHKSSPLRFGGIFHAGVEIAGKEYSFGYAPNGSGVTYCTPRKHPGHHYRETCEMQHALLSQQKVAELVRELAKSYQGPTYHLLRRNCCTFAADLCQQLGAGLLPPWVQRLAHVGDSVLGASEELARVAPLSCAMPDPGAASIAWQQNSLQAVNAGEQELEGLARRKTTEVKEHAF